MSSQLWPKKGWVIVDPFHRFLQKNQCFADISGFVPLLLFEHVIRIRYLELRCDYAEGFPIPVCLRAALSAPLLFNQNNLNTMTAWTSICDNLRRVRWMLSPEFPV